MPKSIVYTTNAPAPIGPYNQAVWAGNLLFVSGQIAINPETSTLIEGDLTAEAKQVMNNIQAILVEAGLSLNDVVKSSIFLKSMDDFTAINAIYGSYFQEGQEPARETVEVARLPKDVNVEISVVAAKG